MGKYRWRYRSVFQSWPFVYIHESLRVSLNSYFMELGRMKSYSAAKVLLTPWHLLIMEMILLLILQLSLLTYYWVRELLFDITVANVQSGLGILCRVENTWRMKFARREPVLCACVCVYDEMRACASLGSMLEWNNYVRNCWLPCVINFVLRCKYMHYVLTEGDPLVCELEG